MAGRRAVKPSKPGIWLCTGDCGSTNAGAAQKAQPVPTAWSTGVLTQPLSDAVITPRNAAETLAESLQTGLLIANDETSDPYSMIWMNGHGQVQEVRVVPLDLDEKGIYNLESPVVAEQAGMDATRTLRCAGGDQCVRSGFWFTPAKAGSRQYFSAGDLMPEVTSDYGATIWHWDQNQESSKP
jgi:hypothetical protein